VKYIQHVESYVSLRKRKTSACWS